MIGPSATPTAAMPPIAPYARARASPSKFDWMSVCNAGITRVAPSPSSTDQPRMRTPRFGATAVTSAPAAKTIMPRRKVRRRPRISPTLPPVIIMVAITRV